jgi:hypothetical protein
MSVMRAAMKPIGNIQVRIFKSAFFNEVTDSRYSYTEHLPRVMRLVYIAQSAATGRFRIYYDAYSVSLLL